MGLSIAVQHRQGDFALDVTIETEARLLALFGPSGCGKTTLTRLIAGLAKPEQGRIAIGNAVLLDTQKGIDLPPYRRRIGCVFQEPRLFPHLTVSQNLRYARLFHPGSGRNIDAVISMLGIAPLLQRRPGALSGGEKQRVAIGRALLSEPQLLVMDEPLAALDQSRKLEILPYIERLRDELNIPIIYVSHIPAEIARLASAVAVMETGKVVALGEAADVLLRSDIPALADRGDLGSVLDATVIRHDTRYRLSFLATRAGELIVPLLSLAPQQGLRVWIEARDIIVTIEAPAGTSALNILPTRIVSLTPGTMSGMTLRLDCGGASLLARITRLSADRLDLKPGLAVFAVIKAIAVEQPLVSATSNTSR